MFILKVPYAEKDLVRELGARWHVKRRTWYVPKGALLAPFERWMPHGDAADEMSEQIASERKRRAAGLVPLPPKRKLSQTPSAIQSRAKKAAKRVSDDLERALSIPAPTDTDSCWRR